MPHLLAATSLETCWPFVVLAASIAFIVIGISVLRLHAFLALILAALLAGCLSRIFPDSTLMPDGTVMVRSVLDVVKLVSEGFGKTAGGIAISIGLASIIGFCLMESGAADRVVRSFLRVFGEKNVGLALLVSTYLLSVPIFFDTMFMLMAPLAKALHVRTGKDYLLYVLCVCCGGVVTHCLTIPHPGPIAMAENLHIDVGFSIVGAILAGLIPAAVGYGIATVMNRRWPTPLRETPGLPLAELATIVDKKDSELPSLTASFAPIVLPILLISFSSVVSIAAKSGATWLPGDGVREAIGFIGDKNIALFIGAFLSIALLIKQKGYNRAQVSEALTPPMETAGVIILITSAGGAFGYMIRNAGVGPAITKVSEGASLNLIFLAYALSLVMRVAQGSSTVAMLTASSIIFPMIGPGLPYHPLYLFLGIGFASFALGWMNDSGFWVVSRLSGLTEKEMLKSFSFMLTLVSLTGLLLTWIGSKLLPLI